MRLVREVRPDLVFVSADSDSDRAIALAEGIKQNADTKSVPVVVAAKHTGPIFRHACLAAGIDDVIAGSVSDAVLTARLAPLFRLSTMTGELSRRWETMRAFGLDLTAEPTPSDSGRPRVLMTSARADGDDSPGIEAALSGDYSVTRAADTFSAADLLSSASFDALILVPNGDVERTLHLCAHIRNNPRLFNLPVLIVAERDSFEDIATPYHRGASIVIFRPIELAELRDYTMSLVRRQRQRHVVRQGLRTALQPRTEDAITGLFDQTFFAGHLSRLIANAGLTQKPLSVVLFDVQNTAWFDRQFGDGAGHKVLRQVGQWIAGLVRAEDLPARLGESTFAVILPDTSLDESLIAANRIAGVLLNTDFTVEDGMGADPLRVWVETGSAAAEPGDTVDGLVSRARSRLR